MELGPVPFLDPDLQTSTLPRATSAQPLRCVAPFKCMFIVEAGLGRDHHEGRGSSRVYIQQICHGVIPLA